MTFKEAQLNDPLVHSFCACGLPMEDLVAALVERHQVTLEHLKRIYAIAPFKIKLQDGTVLVWRCPDDMVPERGL